MINIMLVTTMQIQGNSDVVESFMASTIQNFTNISKMTRRRYRSIIPSTTRKFKRLGDISGIPDGVQSTQSPQDLPPSKPPRSSTTPVHTRNLEDFEKAVMEFMQEPLVSLAKPTRPTRRRPLKCIQEKGDTEYSVVPDADPGLEDRLHRVDAAVVEDDNVPKQVSPCRDQTVPCADSKMEHLLRRTHDFPETSETITSSIFEEMPGWSTPLQKKSPNTST